MTEAEHDMLKENANKIAAIEKKIDGIVPEQCLWDRFTLTTIKENQDKFSKNLNKMMWVLIVAAIGVFANIVSNHIRWDIPTSIVGNGSAQATTRSLK
jgi:hypothetical protein